MKKPNERERNTIKAMIRIYCHDHHHGTSLCEECNQIRIYAEKRIDHCIYGTGKPACKDCPVHCYSPKMREKVKEVMRFSGPKMIYKHPVMAIMHLMK
jgi:hypothetical protein